MPNHSRRRRSLRLPEFDYGSHGAYFVTTVTQDRRILFGDVADGAFTPNAAGNMLDDWWHRLASKFEGSLELDEFVVMPNHAHGILWLTKPDGGAGEATRGRPASGIITLSTVLDWYKTMTTNAYIRGVRGAAWPPFARRVWQRGYYEHVVRDDGDLNRIRQYMIDNPARWSEDEERPDQDR